MIKIIYKNYILDGNINLERIIECGYFLISNNEVEIHVNINDSTLLFEMSKGIKSYLSLCKNFKYTNSLGVYENVIDIVFDLELFLSNFTNTYKCEITIETLDKKLI